MNIPLFVSSTSVPELVKILVKRHLSKIAPDILSTLNLYYLSRYRKDAITFFVESPCRFYTVLKETYKGGSIDMILKLFIKSISSDPKTIEVLVSYIKTCNDKAFNEAIAYIVQDKLQKEK